MNNRHPSSVSFRHPERGAVLILSLLLLMAMTLLGLAIGIGIGIGVTLVFSQVGIGFGDGGELLAQYGISERLYPRLTVISTLTGPLIIAVITFFTALIPALKIPRMRPVEAMRAV